MPNDPIPMRGLNKYSAIVLSSLLVAVVVTVGFLAWSGKDIEPYIGFIIGFIPPTVAALISVRQNEQLLRYSGEIKANVNGNLTRLVEAISDSVPVASLEAIISTAIKTQLEKKDSTNGE